MKAEIITVGSELLEPGKRDAHGPYLTEELSALGISVVHRATVGDDPSAIEVAARQALERAELILVTGGLGPTTDDCTREAFAAALGRTMAVDEAVLAGIRARFEKRGLEMAPVNRKQALVPSGAEVLENTNGTAPGLWMTHEDGKIIILLPGPPGELRPMFERLVRPRLEVMAGALFHDVLKLWVVGLPESSVEQRIAHIYAEVDNPVTTILASAGQIEIRLVARGGSAEEARAANTAVAVRLRAVLGEHIFSEREQSLEMVVNGLLERKAMRLTLAESLTGGLIAHRVTQVPGASRVFDQGVVTYSNESKTRLLGVDPALFERVGAVSEEVAEAMAVGARERAYADLGLAVTGIAGPSGGSDSKPVGLVFIGLAWEGGSRAWRFQFPGDRRQVKRWTSQAALNLVRLHLMNGAVPG